MHNSDGDGISSLFQIVRLCIKPGRAPTSKVMLANSASICMGLILVGGQWPKLKRHNLLKLCFLLLFFEGCGASTSTS